MSPFWELPMILDRLENADAHTTLGPEVAVAFAYLRRTDFSKLANGRYDIDGDRVYAIVQRYVPKPLKEAKWEAHQKYLDVQYMASGSERMGCAPLRAGLPIERPYDPKGDAALYRVDGKLFVVPQGSFAIFAPEDIHSPGLALENPGGEVCKVVVKCRLANR
jgi:YhcH/YjgK/YiaL family protein